MTTLSTNMPAQAAMVGYLKEGGYESHLRRLRRNLEVQRDHMLRGIAEYFPEGTRATRPEGGYFLWVELPREVNALRVHRQALARGISIAPGPIFSAQHGFQNFIRLNYGHPWTAKFEKGLASLGKIAQSQR
jgi:DNA-binding transcriptional MocR family regulator